MKKKKYNMFWFEIFELVISIIVMTGFIFGLGEHLEVDFWWNLGLFYVVLMYLIGRISNLLHNLTQRRNK